MQEQNFNNHKKYVIGYHIITFGLAFFLFILSVYFLISTLYSGEDILQGFMFLAASILFLLMFYYTRSFALRAQDRAIRCEENFRHHLLTGKILNSKISMPQILALRFAPDDEFIELAQRAADENLNPGDIKRSIKKWKGDYYRV